MATPGRSPTCALPRPAYGKTTVGHRAQKSKRQRASCAGPLKMSGPAASGGCIDRTPDTWRIDWAASYRERPRGQIPGAAGTPVRVQGSRWLVGPLDGQQKALGQTLGRSEGDASSSNRPKQHSAGGPWESHALLHPRSVAGVREEPTRGKAGINVFGRGKSGKGLGGRTRDTFWELDGGSRHSAPCRRPCRSPVCCLCSRQAGQLKVA